MQLVPVVSCLVIKDSTPVIAGGRGNRRAIQIKHDWKSAQNKKGKLKKRGQKTVHIYHLPLVVNYKNITLWDLTQYQSHSDLII